MPKFLNFKRSPSLTDTTRKSTKTNKITDEIFSSVKITDGNNFVSTSVGIYRQITPVGDTVGIYRQYIPTVSPTDSIVFLECCNSVMMWIFFRRLYQRNDREIQIGISVKWRGTFIGGITDEKCPSVIPSVKVNWFVVIVKICRFENCG
jgi:hypothetical protein